MSQAPALKNQIESLGNKLVDMNRSLRQARIAHDLLLHHFKAKKKTANDTPLQACDTAKRYFNQVIKPHRNPDSSTRLVVNAASDAQPIEVLITLKHMLQTYVSEQTQLFEKLESDLDHARRRLRLAEQLNLVQANDDVLVAST